MSREETSGFFSLEEVNALIPHMEERFQKFWSYRESAQNILEELRRNARKAETSNPLEIAHNQVRQSQAHFLLEQGKKELESIMELGGIIKDLEIGLVDFPHLDEQAEDEVYLCWKFGEKKIRYWHGLNEGFTSRKPITRRVHH